LIRYFNLLWLLPLFLTACASRPVAQVIDGVAQPSWRPVISNDAPPIAYSPSEPPYVPIDGSRGAELFRKCAPCHSIRPESKNSLGPKLFGVAGRRIAVVEGYQYSDALKAFDNVWSDENLDAFLMFPRGFAPGNKMTFRGINNAQDRTDLILFLKSQR
jgi:cytochrome c